MSRNDFSSWILLIVLLLGGCSKSPQTATQSAPQSQAADPPVASSPDSDSAPQASIPAAAAPSPDASIAAAPEWSAPQAAAPQTTTPNRRAARSGVSGDAAQATREPTPRSVQARSAQPRSAQPRSVEVARPEAFPMEMAAPVSRELAPQELAPRAELVSKKLRFVKVFYGTNRIRASACTDDTSRWDDRPGCRPEEFYGIDAADTQGEGASAGGFGLDVGTLTVTFPADHRKTKIERPVSIFGYDLRGEDPSRDVVISELHSYSSDYQAWLDEVRGSGRRQAFIYVHGFANSFPVAARRAAQVAYDLDFDVEPDFAGLTMMFSWPSRGSVSPTAYTSDYDASDQAVEAFNQFLDLVTSKYVGLEQVHVIAHSMGNRLVANALSARASRPGNSDDRIIDELVLAAPDIPATTFKTRFLRTLPAFAARVTLYVSDKDLALYASSRARDQEARAGQVDGGLLDVDVDRLDVIDASLLETDFLSHDYYASNNSMLSDIYSLLKRIPADQRPLLRPAGHAFRFVTGEEVVGGGVMDPRRWSPGAVWAGAAGAVMLMGWVVMARGRGVRPRRNGPENVS